MSIIGGYYVDADGKAAFGTDYENLRNEFDGKMDITFEGVVPQPKVAEIMAKASYFRYPTEYPETYGISTIESLSYNTPVIGCRFGVS